MERQLNKLKNTDFGTELAKILPLIMREFTRRQQKNIFAKGLLTVPQVVILDFLAERGCSQMNELAKVLNFSMSAVTAIVDKMIALKLLKRERSSEDRRVVKVTVLNKGKEAIRQVREARRNCATDLFSALTEKERAEYLRMLRKVANSLRQRQ